MKNVFKYMAGVLFAGLTMTACSPESYDGADGNLPSIADYADNFSVSVDQSTNTATMTFVEAPGVTPVWIVDGETYSGQTTYTRYWRKKGEHQIQAKVKNRNGISDGAIDFNINIEKTKMNGFSGFDPDGNNPNNLLNGAPLNNNETWFADEGWGKLDTQPVPSVNGGEIKITLPEGMGSQRWQGQLKCKNTGIQTSSEYEYDFSAIVTMSKKHNGFKIKLCAQDDEDNNILLDKDFKVTEANEPVCFYASELSGIDTDNLMIVFDFGGGEAETEVIIENLCLIRHDLNEIEAPEELAIPFNYDDPNNVWKQIDEAGAFEEGCWFGDAGWGDMGVKPEDLKSVHEGSSHTITIPATTMNEQWHAQYKWELNKDITLPFSGNDVIDFSCEVTTTKNLPGATFKFTQSDNDENFFFADRIPIKAGNYVVRYEGVSLSKGEDAPNMKFVFDFAGAEEGTVITIKNVTVIKH